MNSIIFVEDLIRIHEHNTQYSFTMSNVEMMNRRKFIRTGVARVAGLSLAQVGWADIQRVLPPDVSVDKVKLGNTGLEVSRIALGTGTKGWNYESNQTRIGLDNFVKLAHHGYERGLRFFDMADMYGSQPFVGKALKELPREKVTLMTKMWTYDEGSEKREPVRKTLDRFRQEAGTEYFDILLMHCMTDGNWPETRKFYMEGLAKAKEEGIVKAVGISCHNWDAMAEAAQNPWCDIVLARLNPFQSHMDGTPEDVNVLLGKARENGKGIMGMKIFGEGKHVTDEERERSIHFAVTESNLHCMTLGLESIAQMDDAIERVMRNVKNS